MSPWSLRVIENIITSRPPSISHPMNLARRLGVEVADIWDFPKIRGTLFWSPLLFRVLYQGPRFSEPPPLSILKLQRALGCNGLRAQAESQLPTESCLGAGLGLRVSDSTYGSQDVKPAGLKIPTKLKGS